MGDGDPISYAALQVGTSVFAADGSKVGTVRRVDVLERQDIFVGIDVHVHHHGDRFVDADDIELLAERAVRLSLQPDALGDLPSPKERPAAYEADPVDVKWKRD